MHIDQLIHLVKNPHPSKPLVIPESWSQGRTVYGGLSAALVYTAARERVSPERLLRSFNCNFVGPFYVDQAFTITVDVLREGRNVTTIQSSIVQNDSICVHTQSVFGAERASDYTVNNNSQHSMPIPKKHKENSDDNILKPLSAQNFELVFVDGGIPVTQSKDSHLHGWMRFKKAPETVSDAHLLALIDAWPPPVLQMLAKPAPISSMIWNVEFIHPMAECPSDAWFAYQAESKHLSKGYGIFDAKVWDSENRPVALSNQIVTLFA